MIRNELVSPTATRQFLEDRKASIRTRASQDTYRYDLELLQRSHPDRRVSEFTEADLVKWCNDGGSPSSILRRRKVVIGFFRWAAWKGLTEKDPAANLKDLVTPPRHGVKQHNWLTAGQLHQVLATCDSESAADQRDRIVILFAAMTGLRRQELANLQWGHVDLRARTVFVFGKGEKPATIGIPNRLAEALFQWQGMCAVGLDRPPSSGDPVFPRIRHLFEGPTVMWSKPMSVWGIFDVVRNRGHRAGIPNLAPHDLRRTFIDMMAEQLGIERASAAARHSNIGTTQVYLEDSPRRAIQAGHDFDIAL